ncbi:MAG TPA: c-type cytochrome, partial [Nitrospiria bacterium]|nr:c-type cytochrome [Nitrospiria bacterium]
MKKWMGLIAFCAVWSVAAAGLAGDPVAGKDKVKSCIGCHPVSGHHSDPAMPGVAGQEAEYTVLQLKAYKEKSRKHMIMNSLTGRLSDADMEDIAAFYAGLEPMTSESDPALAEAGKAKYTLCQKCHGPSGGGKGVVPRLAGQQPEYTFKELQAYKSGKRKNPPMNALAGALSEAD